MRVTVVGRGNTRTVRVLFANESRYDGTEEVEEVEDDDDEEGAGNEIGVA
jgi:hypothetical protein